MLFWMEPAKPARALATSVAAFGFSAVAAVVACGGTLGSGTGDGGPLVMSDGGSTDCNKSPGAGTSAGSVSGATLNVVGVTAVYVLSNELEIVLSDMAAGCARQQSGPDGGTQTTLKLYPPAAVGTYDVNISGPTSASFGKFDFAKGDFVTAVGGFGGTVTVASISACAVRGSFDVFFLHGDRLQGTFNAPICGGADAGSFSSDGGTTRD